MATKPTKVPQFADLRGILAQSKADANEPMYHTLQILLERLDQLKDVTITKINDAQSASDKKFASQTATYHTKLDETTFLPQSVQLLAGSGIIFDDSVANKRTILTAIGGNHYDAPLSDGDKVAADLIYANGECIIVQVPV
jgi:hypothetical protein